VKIHALQVLNWMEMSGLPHAPVPLDQGLEAAVPIAPTGNQTNSCRPPQSQSLS